MKKRIITLDITVANGTAAGTYSGSVKLPAEYDRVASVAFLEKSAGGLTKYNIGLQEYEGKQTVDPQDRLGLVVTGSNGMGIPPMDRARRDIQFPIDGSNKKTVVTITTYGSTSSDLELQAIFECVADK